MAQTLSNNNQGNHLSIAYLEIYAKKLLLFHRLCIYIFSCMRTHMGNKTQTDSLANALVGCLVVFTCIGSWSSELSASNIICVTHVRSLWPVKFSHSSFATSIWTPSILSSPLLWLWLRFLYVLCNLCSWWHFQFWAEQMQSAKKKSIVTGPLQQRRRCFKFES